MGVKLMIGAAHRTMIASILVSASCIAALAQQPAPAPRPPTAAPKAQSEPPASAAASKQMTSSPTAVLYRVDEGMFDLRRGQSIDLTDRKILLTVKLEQSPDLAERKRIQFSIMGLGWSAVPGERINLKQTGYETVNKIFADKTVCYLDLIDVAVPKGAQPVATFRFECD
jgi:hypothetical protein